MATAAKIIHIRPEPAASYTVEFARREPRSVAAYVHKSDGTSYGVQIVRDVALCSCPDSMYRARACKHVSMVYAKLNALEGEV